MLAVTANSRPIQTAGARIYPQPATLQVGEGQVESLTLLIENAEGVYGIDVRASFDPALVEVVDADLTVDGVQMTPGTFPQPDFSVRNTVDNAAGTLMYVVTQVNPTPPASGSGLVLSIQIRGKSQVGQSPFTIVFVELVDREGRTLDIESQDGIIQLGPPQSPTSVDTAASLPALDSSTTGEIELPGPEGSSYPINTSSLLVILLSLGGLGVLTLVGIGGWLALKPSGSRRKKPK